MRESRSWGNAASSYSRSPHEPSRSPAPTGLERTLHASGSRPGDSNSRSTFCRTSRDGTVRTTCRSPFRLANPGHRHLPSGTSARGIGRFRLSQRPAYSPKDGRCGGGSRSPIRRLTPARAAGDRWKEALHRFSAPHPERVIVVAQASAARRAGSERRVSPRGPQPTSASKAEGQSVSLRPGASSASIACAPPSLVLILTALTAPVAPACSVNRDHDERDAPGTTGRLDFRASESRCDRARRAACRRSRPEPRRRRSPSSFSRGVRFGFTPISRAGTAT